MARARFKYQQALEVETAAGTLPVPTTGTDGALVPISGDNSWDKGGNGRARHTMFLIEASGALTLTGPVNVWGYVDSTSEWYLAAVLSATDIVFAGDENKAFVAEFVSGFDRLALACAVSANNVTVRAVPIV